MQAIFVIIRRILWFEDMQECINYNREYFDKKIKIIFNEKFKFLLLLGSN